MQRKEINRLYYISFFVLFGLLTALITSVVFYRLSSITEERRINERADEVMAAKINEIVQYKQGLENILVSLRDNPLLSRYLKAPTQENLENVQQLFYGISSANRELMQARFIDITGSERVRVDYIRGKKKPTIVPNKDLQNKGHRYYFQDAIKVLPGTCWYSRIDLNRERGQIEKPVRPVLRVASPLEIDGQVLGIVIINVHARDFLESLVQNQLFNIYLVDRDGYFIAATDATLSWSRYLKTGYTIQSRYPGAWSRIVQRLNDDTTVRAGEVFAADMHNSLGEDGAVLIFRVREEARKVLQEEKQKAVVLVIGVIVLLSLPLSWLISRGPVRLYAELERKNSELQKNLQLIDAHVARYTVEESGKLVSGSTAFFDLLHASSEELTGKSEREIYCKKDPKSQRKELLQSVKKGENWRGEIHFSKGDESCFWADVIASPLSESGEGGGNGYSVICHDITDKKLVEQLSITDGLTGLYNRRHFDTIFADEFNRALRDQRSLGFAMLDVDHFKQYNDNYGHQEGDLVLQSIAVAISNRLRRPGDSCFRLGGEEFGIVFLDESPGEALKFMESMRKVVSELGIEHKWSDAAEVVTVSIGLISAVPDREIDPKGFMRLADDALYRAKDFGRNCVELSSYSIA